MRIHAKEFNASAASAEYEDMAFFFAKAADGCCFSLSRPVGAAQIEVMVRDQLNHNTARVSAKLSRTGLSVHLPVEIANELDGNTEYEIFLSASPEQLVEIHNALQAIFKDLGHYAAEL